MVAITMTNYEPQLISEMVNDIPRDKKITSVTLTISRKERIIKGEKLEIKPE